MLYHLLPYNLNLHSNLYVWDASAEQLAICARASAVLLGRAGRLWLPFWPGSHVHEHAGDALVDMFFLAFLPLLSSLFQRMGKKLYICAV